MNTLHYYVYYKLDPARNAELRGVVEGIMQRVHAATGIRGEWQRRRDDPSTFMEIYSNVANADAFERALAVALGEAGFARLGAQRVTEIFQCA